MSQDIALVELRGFEPPRFPAKTACEMRFVDPDVVTRAVVVLEVCADVLRDVTVLAPVEPWSLGYSSTPPRSVPCRPSRCATLGSQIRSHAGVHDDLVEFKYGWFEYGVLSNSLSDLGRRALVA